MYQYDKLPSYYIFAGFVFLPLTKPYMNSSSKKNMRKSVFENMPKKTGEQIVIISQVCFSLSLNSIATIMSLSCYMLVRMRINLICYLLIVYIVYILKSIFGAGVRG